ILFSDFNWFGTKIPIAAVFPLSLCSVTHNIISSPVSLIPNMNECILFKLLHPSLSSDEIEYPNDMAHYQEVL
ncbi:MAG: hypothetical protein M3264_02600, partial [Thermoproteota archaeon]|nr:hypothetical protein [Thermoproteota archaeon]